MTNNSANPQLTKEAERTFDTQWSCCTFRPIWTSGRRVSIIPVLLCLNFLFLTIFAINANGASDHDHLAIDAAQQTVSKFFQKGTGVTVSDIEGPILNLFPASIVNKMNSAEIAHLADVYSGRIRDLLPEKLPNGEDRTDVMNHARDLFDHILTYDHLYR
ncbi:MAG: hypothetical protein F4Z14_01585 [Gammaproteobacteria bacterium]|nr:hypothetical protein [Gammaproteobacteria bacterium]